MHLLWYQLKFLLRNEEFPKEININAKRLTLTQMLQTHSRQNPGKKFKRKSQSGLSKSNSKFLKILNLKNWMSNARLWSNIVYIIVLYVNIPCANITWLSQVVRFEIKAQSISNCLWLKLFPDTFFIVWYSKTVSISYYRKSVFPFMKTVLNFKIRLSTYFYSNKICVPLGWTI